MNNAPPPFAQLMNLKAGTRDQQRHNYVAYHMLTLKAQQWLLLMNDYSF